MRWLVRDCVRIHCSTSFYSRQQHPPNQPDKARIARDRTPKSFGYCDSLKEKKARTPSSAQATQTLRNLSLSRVQSPHSSHTALVARHHSGLSVLTVNFVRTPPSIPPQAPGHTTLLFIPYSVSPNPEGWISYPLVLATGRTFLFPEAWATWLVLHLRFSRSFDPANSSFISRCPCKPLRKT